MQVIISTRGMTVSKTYKDAVSRKLAKLERLLPKIVEAKIVLSKEKHRRTAGLTLIAKHRTFRSEETADDLAAAVDKAVEALQRQVREIKDRVKQHKPRRFEVPAPVRGGEPVSGPDRDVIVRQVTPKPMSVEEAVEQFHLGREQFLVFTNALTDAVNVLYRRKDGGLGLIEPVA
jgi:putative sigma-54 modulation protein